MNDSNTFNVDNLSVDFNRFRFLHVWVGSLVWCVLKLTGWFGLHSVRFAVLIWFVSLHIARGAVPSVAMTADVVIDRLARGCGRWILIERPWFVLICGALPFVHWWSALVHRVLWDSVCVLVRGLSSWSNAMNNLNTFSVDTFSVVSNRSRFSPVWVGSLVLCVLKLTSWFGLHSVRFAVTECNEWLEHFQCGHL